jgi:hypothetical protein
MTTVSQLINRGGGGSFDLLCLSGGYLRADEEPKIQVVSLTISVILAGENYLEENHRGFIVLCELFLS